MALVIGFLFLREEELLNRVLIKPKMFILLHGETFLIQEKV